MRILLVEDDREAAGYLVKGLTESGHAVEHAADGDKGLQLATDNAYDALIVDRMLPKRDGLSLIEDCLLYTSPSPRDATLSRMPSSA